ncbi:flagellar transcriptional regulator FlhD [Modicisalibacter luteus]|uniref:Flagellar transcriptional regulator FlhD n=1 Tax=Modicisalibacter luteus TaxID=453962 RepID=A0ABV7M211_9GAMM|nr:flagellar transcriptional regulator FlhD [Halomonas lutea]GHB14549.1 hypothetical protein GCM10007159_41150 [Halomonas lutea]
MQHGSLLNDIQEINLTYFLLAKRMIKEDRDTAWVRLKITSGMADLVAALSTPTGPIQPAVVPIDTRRN